MFLFLHAIIILIIQTPLNGENIKSYTLTNLNLFKSVRFNYHNIYTNTITTCNVIHIKKKTKIVNN